MKSSAVLIALLTLQTPALAQSGGPDPDGVWMRGDGKARVRIAPCADKICATNLWVSKDARGEAVGDRLVLELKPKDAGTLAGTAYDPQRKLTYSMQMRVGKDELSTRGCLLGKLLCKTVTWSRVD